jgi:hypothetical protein
MEALKDEEDMLLDRELHLGYVGKLRMDAVVASRTLKLSGGVHIAQTIYLLSQTAS